MISVVAVICLKKKNAVGTLQKPQRPWKNQERTLRESAIAGELEG